MNLDSGYGHVAFVDSKIVSTLINNLLLLFGLHAMLSLNVIIDRDSERVEDVADA